MRTAFAWKPFITLTITLTLAAGCGDDGGGDVGPDSAVSLPADAPPIESAALFSYLTAGNYSDMLAESAAHSPTNGSPHGRVRVFINQTLDDSLAAQNSEHPIGAASVKELYRADDTLAGWAVMVKTADESAGGQGWYWYEITSTTDGSNPIVATNGSSICTGCHSAGRDFFRSGYPLLADAACVDVSGTAAPSLCQSVGR